MADGSMMETIKEYLVSLGFDVDKASFNSADKSIKELGHSVTQFAEQTAGKLTKTGVAFTGFITAALVGIAKFLDAMGNAEIRTEMLSRQMWTTEQAARSFDLTLKAMNTNLQSLYLSPTLMKQFQELRQEAQQLSLPSDYKQTIGEINSIQFEFKRLKLEAEYFFREVAYYFVKYFNGPLKDGKKQLQDFNGWIIKHLPELAQKTAAVLVKITESGQEFYNVLTGIGRAIGALSNDIPNDLKPLVAIFAAVGMAIMTGPFGEILLTIGAVMLLLDDFYVYVHHGKSALPGLWSGLDKLYSKMNETGSIKNMNSSVHNLFLSFGDLGKSINGLTTISAKNKNGLNPIISAVNTLSDAINGVSNGIQAVSNWFDKLGQNKSWQRFYRWAANYYGTENDPKYFSGGENGGPSAKKDWTSIYQSLQNGISNKYDPLKKNQDEFFSKLWNGIINVFTGHHGSYQNVPGNSTPSYILPQPSHSTTTNNVTLNQTNHITSPNPAQAASEITDKTKLLIRNIQGVTQ